MMGGEEREGSRRGGGRRREKKSRGTREGERERGRQIHKHTLQIRLHTRGWGRARAHTPGGASKSH